MKHWWTLQKDGQFKCDQCGEEIYGPEDDEGPIPGWDDECPKGEEDE